MLVHVAGHSMEVVGLENRPELFERLSAAVVQIWNSGVGTPKSEGRTVLAAFVFDTQPMFSSRKMFERFAVAAG